MRACHLFALVVSFTLFACVTDEDERSRDGRIELDDALAEDLAELPDFDIDAPIGDDLGDLPMLEHERRIGDPGVVDTAFVPDREVRPPSGSLPRLEAR